MIIGSEAQARGSLIAPGQWLHVSTREAFGVPAFAGMTTNTFLWVYAEAGAQKTLSSPRKRGPTRRDALMHLPTCRFRWAMNSGRRP
jgi:hypothetical protein